MYVVINVLLSVQLLVRVAGKIYTQKIECLPDLPKNRDFSRFFKNRLKPDHPGVSKLNLKNPRGLELTHF